MSAPDHYPINAEELARKLRVIKGKAGSRLLADDWATSPAV
jgi:hypothetical protein